MLIEGHEYLVELVCDGRSLRIEGGRFGEVSLVGGALFHARIKNIENGEVLVISSESEWESVHIKRFGHTVKAYFKDPCGISALSIAVKGVFDDNGISWSAEVLNDNPVWSVMKVTYPIPVIQSERFDLFAPYGSGMVVKDAGNGKTKFHHRYPGGFIVMQYFAVYGENSGIYIGVEDGEGAIKEFSVLATEGRANIGVAFYGTNASKGANSFALSGSCRWQYIKGDWYDATLLYADFVRKKADWLPEIEFDGRADTPKRFKEVPFWVSDYIPNTPSQGDNKPMSLSAGSDLYDKDYWVDAVIELQKELQVPLAYHVYNWHEIPFNIEYPHFLPAKKEFITGAKKLREHPIYILPYINAGSWEMHDAEMGHKCNFDNVGKHGAVINDAGGFSIEHYPQTTQKGETSLLAHMCPSSREWHTTVGDLVREMEDTLPIDGVYFDQIGAIPASPCFNDKHGHLTGGGKHWAEGYRMMMGKINAEKPEDNFYFTENNAENFAKSYDGFLTWMWVRNGQVPAFSAVYAGYIEMIGRCTIGKKKEDYDFFKFSLAEALLYGQQLGWCKADVLYDKKRMSFLKQLVRLRYSYTELFHCSDLMRPPKINSSIPPKTTSPALSFKEDVVMEQMLAGAWRYRNKEKLVIFCINIAEEAGAYSLSFPAKEYGLEGYELPEDMVIDGDTCKISGKLEAESVKVWELKRKQA